jgi:hypothetical protein
VAREPYYGVTQPSDVVVTENAVRPDTRGAVEEVDAKHELLKRGQYTLNVNPAHITPVRLDRKAPLELYEARNAVGLRGGPALGNTPLRPFERPFRVSRTQRAIGTARRAERASRRLRVSPSKWPKMPASLQ